VISAAGGVVTVAPPAHAAKCAATYVVKAGDSWWCSSKKTKLRVDLSLNNAEKSTKLLAVKTEGVPGATPVLTPQQLMSRAKRIEIISDAWPGDPEEHALTIA
jgi:hypothetical protein